MIFLSDRLPRTTTQICRIQQICAVVTLHAQIIFYVSSMGGPPLLGKTSIIQRYARPRSGNLPAFFRGVGQACYSVQYKPRSRPPLLGGAGSMGMYGIRHTLPYV